MIDSPIFEKLQIDENAHDSEFISEVLKDYWVCCVSREASLLGRKEVLTGKAKFGILGDGKELPQVAMARAFKKGDFRSGYYRDQTFMFAAGLATVRQFFAQLYADAENDPFSGGRQMNAHFATDLLDDKGEWLDHTERKNVSADVSSTGGQMARALGIASASKKYRNLNEISQKNFSKNGDEVSFCTIGDASTSEGVFWETVNAAAVTQVPLVICIWDDGYGISVPKELQTAKGSISEVLKGFASENDAEGVDIYKVKAWDYPALVEAYEKGIQLVRENHKPALFHIEECTQPQGHSTSGSHERYKNEERLEWEEETDCILKFEEWIVDAGLKSKDQLEEIRDAAIQYAREEKAAAWKEYRSQVNPLKKEFQSFITKAENLNPNSEVLKEIKQNLKSLMNPVESEIVGMVRQLRFEFLGQDDSFISEVNEWLDKRYTKAKKDYHTNLYSNSEHSALTVPVIYPEYNDESKSIPGHKILNKYFDGVLESRPEVVAFGEDLGKIGDVNQGFAGMQEKYGKERIYDVGIREWTIMGEAIGLSMRGLRPIAEIQYLDYLIYGLSPLSDDLATVRYRSDGKQKAPAIIRTRGHRLEGIWHAGSPLGMLINALRGMHIIVPRDMTRAAGFYQTLLQSDDPGLVIESLNGYRLREKLPVNLGEYSLPLGVPEILREGSDITLVTYGSLVRVVESAAEVLAGKGISSEVIDVQTLLPFDLENICLESLKKTSRLLVIDEDVPGGASAYIQNQILEKQGGYYFLDSEPQTLTAHAHRTPFGSDGDYYTKPNEEDIIEQVYQILREAKPEEFKFPL